MKKMLVVLGVLVGLWMLTGCAAKRKPQTVPAVIRGYVLGVTDTHTQKRFGYRKGHITEAVFNCTDWVHGHNHSHQWDAGQCQVPNDSIKDWAPLNKRRYPDVGIGLQENNYGAASF